MVYFNKRFIAVIMLFGFVFFAVKPIIASTISDPLTCIESLHEAIHKKNRVPGPNAQADEDKEIRTLVIQTQLVQQALLDIVAKIDDSLDYWKSQKYHPNWYLFNKGPQGWLNKFWYGNQPDDEIAMNVATLKQYEEQYCSLLGKLTQVLEQVPNKFKEQKQIIQPEHYPWVSTYKMVALDTFATLQKPSHVQQHWMKYVTAGLGLAIAGSLAYAKKDNIVQMIKDLQTGIKKRYEENLAGPIKELTDVIFDKNSEKLESRPILDTESGRKKLFKQYEEFNEAQKKQLEKIFETVTKELTLETQQKQDILKAIKCDDIKEAADLLGSIDANNREVLSKEFGIFSALTSKSELNRAITNMVQIGMLHKIDLSTLFITSWLQRFISLILFDTWTPLEQWLQSMCKDIELILKKQRINLILSAMIPTLIVAGVGGYGVKKAMSLFKRKAKDFQPLRETFSTIKMLLNRYNNVTLPSISETDTGRLAYLRVKAMRQIDTLLTEQARDRVLNDINEIFRPEFSVSQRLCVLDDMRQKYGFLQHSAKTV